MPIYTVVFRQGGPLTLEGQDLGWSPQQGTATLIWVKTKDGNFAAILPSDAVKAVYAKDAWKKAEAE